MTCTYCGTELPADAMFCGECGRAVTPAAKRAAPIEVPPAYPARQQEPPVQTIAVGLLCENCGAPLAADEIFCGECGAVSQAAARHFSQPRDTAIIEPVVPIEPVPVVVVPEFVATVEEPVDFAPEPVAPASVTREPEPVALESDPEPEPPAARPRGARQLDVPFADDEDVEATRIFGHARPGERFVLQFSTGESSTVYGTGLIGRNPVAEPGEYFDQLVRVVDPSRSVSKSHLEFGQEAGSFWVMDRYSGNGTVLREPDSPAVRCQPERRYRIVRGTRVEIGEQFFIVS